MEKMEFDIKWLVPAVLPAAIGLAWLLELMNLGNSIAWGVIAAIGLLLHFVSLMYLWELRAKCILAGMVCTAALMFCLNNGWVLTCGFLALIAGVWIVRALIAHRREQAQQRRRDERDARLQSIKDQLAAEADADEDIKQQVAATKGNWLRKEMAAKHLKRLYIEQGMTAYRQQHADEDWLTVPTVDIDETDWFNEVLMTVYSFFASLIYASVGAIIVLCFCAVGIYIAETWNVLFFVS